MAEPAILLIDSSKEDWAPNIDRGVKSRKASNQGILEEMITLGDQQVRQIVIPDLYESSSGFNFKKLTDALSRGYDYKLFFFMQASNRGPDDKEVIMMSKINDCIKRVAGLSISFRLIVKKIAFEDVYNMYQDHLANDNCKSFFDSSNIPGFSFDIKIDSVSLVRHEEEKEKEKESIRRILCNAVAEGEMGTESPSTRPRMTAILLFGNAGAGKSTLLTQLGGTKFKAGATFRAGYTKTVQQEQVTLSNGQTVMLVDVPGLFEPNENNTKNNAVELNAALKLDYDFKLFFILKADNRGPSDAEMVMMSKINDCIQQIDGTHVSFRVIVNQIMSDDVNKIYEENVAKDNCKSLFQSLDIPGFSFDIKIDSVMLLRYSPKDVSCGGFKKKMEEEVYQHSEERIRMAKALEFSNDDLKLYQMEFWDLFKKLTKAGGLSAGVAGGAGWLLYHAGKVTHENLKKIIDKED
ncbi:hypothetical protein CPB97_006998 [Podila verticillata]|nr:hypothetical protein CPB97_006998 [Podila verticillata]